MRDVAEGVDELFLAEGTAHPVGELAGFVDLAAHDALDEIVVGDRITEAERHGSDLGVEDRVRRLAGQIVDDFHILAAGVENLEHIFIVDQQFEQRTEVDALGQRIDRGGFLAV